MTRPGAPPTVMRTCPECGAELWVWAGEAGDHYPVPRHWPGGVTDVFKAQCWISGKNWDEGRELVRLRTENGGALLRAAHP